MATEERLSAEEHGLQFVQSVVQLRQSMIQTPLIHLRASLPWNKDLSGWRHRDRRVEAQGGDIASVINW